MKTLVTFAARKKGKQRLFQAEKSKLKNKFAEVKKVRTFAVPKQGRLKCEREGSDFLIIKH